MEEGVQSTQVYTESPLLLKQSPPTWLLDTHKCASYQMILPCPSIKRPHMTRSDPITKLVLANCPLSGPWEALAILPITLTHGREAWEH